MRAICLSFFLLGTGCSTVPAANDQKIDPAIDVQYRLSIFHWDHNKRLLDAGIDDASFRALPSIGQRRELLSVAQSSEVQVNAKCEIRGAEFGACEQVRVSPSTSETVKLATALLPRLRIDPQSLRSTKLPSNRASLDLRIFYKGAKRQFGEECILPLFCGIPTPPAPSPPNPVNGQK